MGKYEKCWGWFRCQKHFWLSFKRNKRHLCKKQLTKEEIKNHKMNIREIYEKFANLSEDELMKRVIKLFMLKIISWQIFLSIVAVKKEVQEQ